MHIQGRITVSALPYHGSLCSRPKPWCSVAVPLLLDVNIVKPVATMHVLLQDTTLALYGHYRFCTQPT